LSFDFDRVIPRDGTASVKYDSRAEVFGRDDVIPLWVADMDFAAPPAVSAALAARAAHPIYGYTRHPDELGDALVDWLDARHRWRVGRDWVSIAPGVVPSLHAAVAAFTQPGDGVIVQPPVYFPFFSAITRQQRRVVENPLRFVDGRYGIDFDHFEACCAGGARLLLLCSPHNPVGRVWTADELGDLLRIARRHGVIVFADEIHHDLVYPGCRHQPLAALDGEDVITAVAPSKSFNIPGLGLSAIIARDARRRSALQQAFERGACGNHNPFSVAAFVAAYRNGAAWLDALLAYLARTREYVAGFVARELTGIRVVPGEGTFLLWLDCRGLGLDDTALARLLVDGAGVGLSPGTLFGTGGSGFMRMNIAAPRALIETALARMRAALRG